MNFKQSLIVFIEVNSNRILFGSSCKDRMFHKTPIKLSTKFDLNSRAITLFYLLQKKRELLALKAKKHTNRMVWLGLGLMSIQAGILARLTWFDYSWDIVEPISYFVSYSAVIGVYAYFVLTRKVNFNTIFN